MESIIDIQIESLNKLLKERKIAVSLTDLAKKALADEGFDPTFGARPLKRLIERKIKNGLALELLQGKLKENSNILVNFEKDKYSFKKMEINQQ